jgi:hypothetical protein
MDLSFRPTAEALENRDAPVILMPVPGLLTLYAVEGVTFPTYSEPQRAEAQTASPTLVPLHSPR